MRQSPIIAAVGEILVEFVSHTTNCGLSQTSDYSGPYPSGAPAIFVDQAARMGSATEMVGGVGDDGNRDFIFHLTDTAADHFETPETLFQPTQTILHVSAASLGNARMREMIMATMRKVSSGRGHISCDPNARPELMRDDAVRDALAEVMDKSTYLLPSTSDLEFLFPKMSEDAAIDHLLNAKAEVIAIKRGSAGVTVLGDGKRHDFAGHAVEEVDPTGAGDCFGGTFVSLLAQGASLHDAGLQANAAGALAVTRRGPMEGNSSPAEITAFLELQNSENVA